MNDEFDYVLMGNTRGLQGFQGLPGEPGQDGKSPYINTITGTWMQWVNDEWVNTGVRADGGGGSGGGGAIVVPFTIPSTAWHASGKFSGYVFQADVEIEGLTPYDYVQMILDSDSVYIANKANVLSGVDIIEGGTRIYARRNIAETLNGYCLITRTVG